MIYRVSAEWPNAVRYSGSRNELNTVLSADLKTEKEAEKLYSSAINSGFVSVEMWGPVKGKWCICYADVRYGEQKVSGTRWYNTEEAARAGLIKLVELRNQNRWRPQVTSVKDFIVTQLTKFGKIKGSER